MSVNVLNLTNGAFVQLSVMTGVLAIKGLACNVAVLMTRLKGGYSILPEDQKCGLASETKPDFSPETKRWLRIVQNDHENIPSFLGLALLWVLAGAAPSETMWPFFIFTAGRIAHTVVFAMGKQPARAIAFFTGLFAHIFVLHKVLALTLPKLGDSF